METVFVDDLCVQGAQLNWCKYLLDELFHACGEAYQNRGQFLYGHLIVSITFLKWKVYMGHIIHAPPECKSLVLTFMLEIN